MSLSRKTSKNSMKGTPESESEKDSAVEDIDYTGNPDLYFSTLKQLEKHSKKVRLHDSTLEKKMMEYLPVNEKFNMNKEGKVLTRWQERQRDWERIQSAISKRINSKNTRPLMMSTTDEFRSRVEEYDLIQAALPLKDRYSEAAWQMTLRGGGPIYCSVGHIFSGIECKVEATVPKPKMIRKPKPPEATFKNDTFLEQTDALVKKVNKYKQSITEIRPHNMSYSDASHLVVRSKNLFQWAKESTAAYFKEKEEAALSVVLEEDSVSIASSVKSQTRGGAGVNGNYDNGGLGPHIEYLSTKEVLFATQWNKNSTQTVSFRNIGTVAVSYRWRKVNNEKEPDGKKKRPASSASQMEMLIHGMKLSDIIQRKGTDEGKLRAAVLNRSRDSFFCLRDSGEILPDETITTTFMFSSRCGAGSFSSQWVLELTPLDAVIYVASSSVLGLDNEPPTRCEGSLCISLRAAVDEPDENMKNRANIAAFVDRRTVETLCFDVVQDCLRRVRDPVRLPDLYARQIDLFKRVNRQRLLDLSSRYTSLLPIFVTPQRLDTFVNFYLTSSAAYVRIKALLSSLRQQDNPELLVNDTYVNPFELSEETRVQLRTEVFPESLIEIFDEVTEEELTPVWNYNLGTIYSALQELLAVVAEVEATEQRIAAREKVEAKERARAEARAARKAAGDDEDEEEEEEEEEEQEELDEQALLRKPKHPLLVEVEGLLHGVGGAFKLLVTRPVDEAGLLDTASRQVAEMTESFNEWRTSALTSAGLLEIVNGGTALPQLPSPFTSAEGCEAWTRALATTTPVAEPVAPVKGAPKPKKGDPVVPTGPTSQQVDFFYRELYGLVRKGLLDMTESLFGSLDEAMESARTQSDADFGLVGETLCTTAVARVEDISAAADVGKVVFVSFDGDAFVNNKHIRSAYDVVGQSKLRAVQPVSRLVEQSVKAIVLLYEPAHATEEQGDILSAYDEIQSLINQQRAAWIEENNKRIKRANKLNKTKNPFPNYKKLDFLQSHSFAALNYQLDNLLRYGETRLIANNPQWSADQTPAYFAQNIPIILLQNVMWPGVVPTEPEYQEAESDDDEPPIYLGRDENKAKSRRDWDSRRPFRVKVDLQVTTLETTAKRKSTGLTSMSMQCYADCAAAVKEAFALASNMGDAVLWVEGTADKLFTPEAAAAFNRVKPVVSERLVSESVREDLVWCGVLQQLPGINQHWKTPEEGQEVSPLTAHLRSLFPYSAHRDVKPTSALVLGGTLRADKFRTMDQMIDLVDTIVIVGEMAIPFIGLSYRVSLLRHQSTVAEYRAVCTQLVRKARLRGCRLMWPSDVVQGEDPLKEGDICKCYDKFEPEARNEGAEYTGDTKTVNYLLDAPLPDDFHLASEEGWPALKQVVVDGYIYDIGPDTIRAMKDIISAADLVLTWGTVGVCELSSFQVGQQSLVDVAAVKAPPSTVVAVAPQDLTRNPQLSLLLGDSCVEWFARLIDSDGEMKGDLVAAGCVSYANRNSAIPCGVLGQYPSSVLREELRLRPAVEGEWLYSKRVIVPEEEEEDEDDEEEED